MAKVPIDADVTELQTLYKDDSNFKSLFDDFAARAKSQRVTKVDQLQNRLREVDLPRSVVISWFRKLETQNHGQFIEGRKGHPSRFVWSSDPIEVGKAAQGQAASVPPISAAANIERNETELPRAYKSRAYKFPLRPSMDATIEIPTDLSEKEADRLSLFIRTLAISSE